MTAANSSKYRGFISYSHEDKAIATWLHRKLQSYQLPRRVANGSDRSLGKFFMDREGLSAAEDLTESLKTALGQSDALIIICSPAAAKSHWVAKEIDTFRELNPNGQILGVIAGGDPAQSSGDTCPYPAPLMKDGREPLAADIRERGTERRLGFLKLVAALADTDPGELLQRDAVRRQQRVTLVTAASALIALTMSSLAVFAFNAQQEAQRRQAQAEGLVDYMLTDLRERLEPLGRLDVLDSVATEVLRYYPEVEDESLGCESAGNLVRALHLATDLKWQSADSAEEASALVDRASKRSERSIKECSSDPQSALDHATSIFYQTGEPHGEGDRNLFLSLTEQQSDLVERYCASAPGDDCTANRAFVQVSYGIANAFFEDGVDFEAAEKHYLSAITLYETSEKFQANNFQMRDYHANAYGWLADMKFNEEDFETAQQLRAKEQGLYRELLALRLPKLNDSEGRLRRRILGANIGRIRALIGAGKLHDADELLNQMKPEADELIRFDPNNVGWKRLIASVITLKAIVNMRLGQREDACAYWEAVERFFEEAGLQPQSAAQVTKRLGFQYQSFCN